MLVKERLALNTPCGDVAHYPEEIEELRSQGTYAVFVARSFKSGKAYIAGTHPDGARILLDGKSNLTICFTYENLPWQERKIEFDGGIGGIFYYKIAPSLEALDEIR